jgi:hypothetical protein
LSIAIDKTAKYTQGIAVFTLPIKRLLVQASMVGWQKSKFEPCKREGMLWERRAETFGQRNPLCPFFSPILCLILLWLFAT